MTWRRILFSLRAGSILFSYEVWMMFIIIFHTPFLHSKSKMNFYALRIMNMASIYFYRKKKKKKWFCQSRLEMERSTFMLLQRCRNGTTITIMYSPSGMSPSNLKWLRINELSSASSSQTITCGVLFCIYLQDHLGKTHYYVRSIDCSITSIHHHLWSQWILKTSLDGTSYGELAKSGSGEIWAVKFSFYSYCP